TTYSYPLSLHDALPISYATIHIADNVSEQATTLLDEEPKLISIDVTTNPGFNFIGSMMGTQGGSGVADAIAKTVGETYTSTLMRSEEHTSELQSRFDLV